MVLEFFRFKTVYDTEEFYQNFNSDLLLKVVISSGITVIGESLSLQLFHPVKGFEIRYITDGSEPENIESSLFKVRLF